MDESDKKESKKTKLEKTGRDYYIQDKKVRNAAMAQAPGFNYNDITKVVRKQWSTLSTAEQQPYEDQANEEIRKKKSVASKENQIPAQNQTDKVDKGKKFSCNNDRL